LTIVVSGDAGVPMANARISGIREVTTVDRQQTPNYWRKVLLNGLASLMVTAPYCYLLGFVWFRGPQRIISLPLPDIGGILILVWLLMGSIWVNGALGADLPTLDLFACFGVAFLVCMPLFFLARKRAKTMYSADTADDT
jgi:hypothetical protein